MSDPSDIASSHTPDAASTAHPDLIAVRAMLIAAGLTPPINGDVQTVRAYLREMSVFASRESQPLAHEQSLTFHIGGRDVPCKLYWPDMAEQPALMFYCHGGGFRHGEIAGWDAPLRQVVRDSGVAVLSIGYALSPEHKFPTALDEVAGIMRMVIAAGTVANRPLSGFAAGGDSAGANLALGAALTLRDAGISALRHLMLLYGTYSLDVSSPSWQRLGNYGGHGLSATSMRAYWDSYLANGEDDWRVQPLHANLAGLPPTCLTVGELDPLIDENMALAEKLRTAGVAVTLTVLPRIIHGVVRFNELAPVVRALLTEEAAKLGRAFQST